MPAPPNMHTASFESSSADYGSNRQEDSGGPPVPSQPMEHLEEGGSFDSLMQWLSQGTAGGDTERPNTPIPSMPGHMELPFHSLPDPLQHSNSAADLNEGQESVYKPEKVEPVQSNKYPLFPARTLQDFKHVLYNLMAEAYNTPNGHTLLTPFTEEKNGVQKHGFKFNPDLQPELRMAELYALYIRKCRIDLEDQNSVFIQDLYKFYLRACVELLSKYFEKVDKFTYLYDEIALFEPGESLEQAQQRLKKLQTRSRKSKRIARDHIVRTLNSSTKCTISSLVRR